MRIHKAVIGLFFLGGMGVVFCVPYQPIWANPEPAAISQYSYSDQEIQALVNAITKELRCLSCKGQSVFDSESLFAVDVRRFVRSELRQGKTPFEIRMELAERFGQNILMTPPLMRKETSILWAVPAAMLLGLGGCFTFRLLRRNARF